MKDNSVISGFLEMLSNISGIELDEYVDLRAEFAEESDNYVFGDWTLVQWEPTEDGGNQISKVLYMKSVKKASKQILWADGIALVGGFIAFIYLLLGSCMRSVNERMMMK